MRRWQRYALGIGLTAGTLVIVLGVGLFWVASSFDDLCGNTVVATEFSPDRTKKAVLFERNCGATTGFSSQVSILSADRALPNEGGNVFAANEAKGGEPTAWGGPFVATRWRDATTLVLRHGADADIRFSADRLDDVAVVFEVAP